MGYCHCSSCRSWSGGPVNAFTLWKPDAVRVTAGAEHVATYNKTKMSFRKFCAKCGGHLMADHPPLGLVDVFAATIPTLDFVPGRPCELLRDGAADARRAAEAEGFPSRNGRIGQGRWRNRKAGYARPAPRLARIRRAVSPARITANDRMPPPVTDGAPSATTDTSSNSNGPNPRVPP